MSINQSNDVETLSDLTEKARKAPVIQWYRTPIDSALMKELHERSDRKGAFQTLGYLGIVGLTGTLAIVCAVQGWWWVLPFTLLLHGMVTAFMINGVHELGHGTVFKTKRWNALFCHVLAFLGWINHETFQSSHARHHRYTLHPPDDLEVVLPIRLMVKHFFKMGFINPSGLIYAIKDTWRIARGRFRGEWELTLYPASAPEQRKVPVRWARCLLVGHGLVVVISLAAGWWIVPVVVTLAPFYGGWLFFLCNNTQHIGLRDNVPDFRLCCRTFTLNPVVRFLYWQMNYHTEHHMYAAVPCYHLGRLHQAIKHDLPYCPDGIAAVWREIAMIQNAQDCDPSYQHPIVLPQTASPARL